MEGKANSDDRHPHPLLDVCLCVDVALIGGVCAASSGVFFRRFFRVSDILENPRKPFSEFDRKIKNDVELTYFQITVFTPDR